MLSVEWDDDQARRDVGMRISREYAHALVEAIMALAPPKPGERHKVDLNGRDQMIPVYRITEI